MPFKFTVHPEFRRAHNWLGLSQDQISSLTLCGDTTP